jgi:hypothetical protein
MKPEEILVCITNHNSNKNALFLKKEFSKYFETIIIDSGSNEILDEFDIKLGNVYYTGLLNESVKQCLDRNKKYLYFIASDVYYKDFKEIYEIISSLEENIYLWAPSSRGQSHYHCKNLKNNIYRDVPYLEGFCFLANIDCFNGLYPVSMDKNLYGYGIDLILGYNCIKVLKKRCVVDDRVEIYHKEGTGYSQGKALRDMYIWMMTDFDEGIREYTNLYRTSWLGSINSPDYKKLLNYLNYGF